ncbi:ABC transporter permease [Brevibacillus choshinensis]|uniref:ABC transporter permease n=1 Tax=Brevibacillus choshinensis TaxID=54911 RepID=UPI002E21372A|nr:ABC transporter permease subunit [Brevibacillus choshinensis]MED4583918.1 ABC transporter permease subunit [Brevibacillus choshinensis]MED4752299.1 ABC transporter permease subunit [Brevibacillus choshinensis]
MNVLRRLRNPVLFNEWKMRMRTQRSPWIIFLYLLVLGGITLLYIFLMTNGGSYYNPNETRELFMMLSILQLGMICFVVPGLTAGVISGERERQTLSILLTTNVSATRLIVGKWLSSLSFMIFLVFATVPLYAIVFLYGGISPIQLIQVFGFYVITMFGIGSIGVLLSTLIKRTGIATVVSYAVVFGFSIGSSVLAEIIRELIRYQRRNLNYPSGPMPVWPDLLHSINPLFAMLNIFDEGPVQDLRRTSNPTSFLSNVDPFWYYVLFFALVTVVCLLLAIYFIQPIRPRLRRAAEEQ